MEKKKDISYLGKDFNQFRKNLIDFSRQYFPQTYTDFSPSSPGMLFIEMAAYVGDVLSFYSDVNLRESFLEQAAEQANIYDLSKNLGYRPKTATPAHVKLDVFQVIPASGSGANVAPDFNYALSIKSGMRVRSTNSNTATRFRTLDVINFAYSSSYDATEVSVYEVDPATNTPTYFLLKKQVNAVSGEIKTQTFSFGSPIPYDTILLNDTNITEIISVTETDGDRWYEVPYLAQDTLFESVPNLVENDPELSQYRSSVPSLLKLRKTAKRFTTSLRSDNRLLIQFGAGISDNNDEEVLPNPDNVGNGLANVRKTVDVDIDPANFLYTRTYGQAPANTTLTVTYVVSNGIEENSPANTLTQIDNISYESDINATTNATLINFLKTTVAVNNPEPATGANGAESLTDIKNNAVAAFSTQNRLVTRDDYIIRAYSMPANFGNVAKAYIVPDDQISQESYEQNRIANPLAMNMYVLGFNELKQLAPLNQAVKENLKTYLGYYRMLTDAVNIKDAFIINIGVDFEISVLPNYNSNEILLQCVDSLRTYFDIDRWQINQPIIKSDITTRLANVKGVQSVIGVKFLNLYDDTFGYSGNVYDLSTATRNGVIYPSLDPSIFEVKFPNQDIRGRVVSY
jgi:hypothetical protein